MVKPISKTYPQTERFPLLLPLEDFKKASLQWASKFDPSACYDSNGYSSDRYGQYEAIIGAGAVSICKLDESKDAFEKLREWYDESPDWAFGYLAYDLKNDVEALSSNNPDHLGFPLLHFFKPVYVLEIFRDSVQIHSREAAPKDIYREIIEQKSPNAAASANTEFTNRISKEKYLETVERIREHIRAGDLYEMNFCQEFFAEKAKINPLRVYQKLNAVSKAPFGAWFNSGKQYLLCSSPERFMQKRGSTLISQPIKGTIGRSQDPEEDHFLQTKLYYSEKDRAENIMIVDLVRNDLARSCKPGTVEVEELFGIYGFEQVYQMISTIKGELREDVHFVDAIKRAFPMGSMTGAPKVICMEMIEAYEESRRGLYSGAVGYITPEGDFDFNVVIRSLQYNAATEYLSYQVGGAIVYDSDPLEEYEECQLKAKGILKALDQETGATLNPSFFKSSQ
ncbi:MAG: anthranilate synthase component I family protein [Bacteroidetes bacterium]|nr:anthranilate synthase component I family protein [Bacteroidota bacterium]